MSRLTVWQEFKDDEERKKEEKMIVESRTSFYEIKKEDEGYIVKKIAIKEMSKSAVGKGEEFKCDRIVFDKKGHIVLEKKIPGCDDDYAYVKVLITTSISF